MLKLISIYAFMQEDTLLSNLIVHEPNLQRTKDRRKGHAENWRTKKNLGNHNKEQQFPAKCTDFGKRGCESVA